jgi:hypothetical protein
MISGHVSLLEKNRLKVGSYKLQVEKIAPG